MQTYSLCLEELYFKFKKNSNVDRDLEVRGSNPGPYSNFSLEFKFYFLHYKKYYMKCYTLSRRAAICQSVAEV